MMETKSEQVLESSALKANLERTAAVVTIPKQFNMLLQSVSEYFGVHKRVVELLTELHHPFVNWDYVADNLKTFSVNDFCKFNAHEKAVVAIDTVFFIYFMILESNAKDQIKDKTLRFLFDFIETMVSESGDTLDRNAASLEKALKRLQNLSVGSEQILRKCSSYVKSFLKRAKKLNFELVPSFMDFAPLAFRQNFNFWLGIEDPVSWFDREAFAGLTSDLEESTKPARIALLKKLIEPISHQNLREMLEKLEKIDFTNLDVDRIQNELAGLPDYNQIVNAYLLIADRIEKEDLFKGHHYLTKLDFLFNILSSESLKELHNRTLQEINRLLNLAFREEPEDRRSQFVTKILKMLQSISKQKQFRSIVLDCIQTLAKDIAACDDRDLFELFVDEVINTGFQYPEASGSNVEWQVQVNPYHIKNIRVWMEIIELKPFWARRLLSALIINLKLGGVLLRDTDLFQRDISQYLNADITKIINLSKQLMRLFPAFYNEIGAEGELREISTCADELCARRDLLVHYIRKQMHVESNNLLVGFLENCFRFWQTAEKEHIRAYLPSEVFSQIENSGEFFDGLHAAFITLLEKAGNNTQNLLALKTPEMEELLSANPAVNEKDRKRAVCIVRAFQLLTKKYNPRPIDLIADLRLANMFEKDDIDELEEVLEKRQYKASLTLVLTFLEQLRERVVSSEQTTPSENIYFKRHIAAGIPSMYGVYREEKFDAVGLTFRLESLGTSLFEQLIAEMKLKFITKSSILKIVDCLPLFIRAFKLEGIPCRQFSSKVNYLGSGVNIKLFSIDQYQDIFINISKSLQGIIRDFYLDVHKVNLPLIINQMIEARHVNVVSKPGDDQRAIIFSMSENFMRSLLSSAFGLQVLDNFITHIINTLQEEVERFRDNKALLNQLVTYNPDIAVSQIHSDNPAVDNQILLGNKGYWLKKMAGFGFSVPQGFTLTTEVYRCFDVITSYRSMVKDITERIAENVAIVEKNTGKKFGDPDNPLLFSVRSGAAISMPGMMDTFLNVGMNLEIAEALSKRPGYEWSAWDSYRRLLQMWGMNAGLDRNFFDQLIEKFKVKYGVEKKLKFSPEQMREITLAYRDEMQSRGVKFHDKPFDQLKYTILKTFQSWNSECATLFRRQMNMSDEWGTAVTVQEMVFGNLSSSSGSGVTFTKDPNGSSAELQLFGDFFFGVQGDDIVSGLIETYPISEAQRIKEKRNSEISLESHFPQTYNKLLGYARSLVLDRDFNHQEIEFTFENAESDGLFILQTRDQVRESESLNMSFVNTPELRQSLAGNGVGVGSGVMTGRAVFSESEIKRLRKLEPDTKLILVRPDTVPEDVPLLLQVEGLLTARGGRTSHAAVTIPTLGKVGVVGFTRLKVFEYESYCTMGTHRIKSGDFLSIDGRSGAVYVGRHQPEESYL